MERTPNDYLIWLCRNATIGDRLGPLRCVGEVISRLLEHPLNY